MKKILNIAIILLIIFEFNVCYAFEEDSDIILIQQVATESEKGQGYQGTGGILNPDKYKPQEPSSEPIMPLVGIILGIIQAIGIVVSVIALMIIGLRSMTGSLEEKSKYKEALPGYILGLVMVVAITTIQNIIYNIVQGTF